MARVPAQQRSKGKHPQRVEFSRVRPGVEMRGPVDRDSSACSTTLIELFAMLGRKARAKGG